MRSNGPIRQLFASLRRAWSGDGFWSFRWKRALNGVDDSQTATSLAGQTLSVQCPGCESRLWLPCKDAIVLVCDQCQSIVTRSGGVWLYEGKAGSSYIGTGSLALKQTGEIDGRRFRLVGQEEHDDEAGGVQCDWYVCLNDGKSAVLSTFDDRNAQWFEEMELLSELPGFDALLPGTTVRLNGTHYDVIKQELRRQHSARGAVTRPLKSGEFFGLVTLQSATGALLRVDYSMVEPKLWLGRNVNLEQLGLLGQQDAFLPGAAEGKPRRTGEAPPAMPRLLLDAFGYLGGADRRITGIDRLTLKGHPRTQEWYFYHLTDFRGRTAFLVDRGRQWQLLTERQSTPPYFHGQQSLMVGTTAYALVETYEVSIDHLAGEADQTDAQAPMLARHLRVYREVVGSGDASLLWWLVAGSADSWCWSGNVVSHDEVRTAFAVIEKHVISEPLKHVRKAESVAPKAPPAPESAPPGSSQEVEVAPLPETQDGVPRRGTLRSRISMAMLGAAFIYLGNALPQPNQFTVPFWVCGVVALIGAIFGYWVQDRLREGATKVWRTFWRE